MKRIIPGSLIVAFGVTCQLQAQGTFLFSNLAGGVNVPISERIFYPNGSETRPLSGPDWIAHVYLASNLENPLETQIFSDIPESAGYFFGPVVEAKFFCSHKKVQKPE